MKQVICISWGTKYGAPYIRRLFGMVRRNITPPFTFTCFCDDPEGLRGALDPEIRLAPMPPFAGPLPVGTTGKWRKSCLWHRDLGGLEGPVLFIDLDVVVTGPLDPFFDHGDPDDVILARNAAKPFQRRGQTSIYRMPAGKLAPLWDRMAEGAQQIAETYRFEQHFVTDNAPGGVRFWPRAWVRHFRIECVPPFPLNYVAAPRLPRGARVVIFAGRLNPDDAAAGRWGAAEEILPHLPPRAHVARALREGHGFGGVRRYLRPTRWVADLWRP